MKKIVLSVVLAAVCLILILPRAFAVDPIERDETAIKAALIDMWDAIEHKDIDRYAAHIHPDFSTFGETNTYLHEGKDLEIRNVRSWLKNAEGVHTEMHQPKVTVRGETAWISYYWTDSGVDSGKAFSSRGKSTRIFAKEDGRWLCIHAHHTFVE